MNRTIFTVAGVFGASSLLLLDSAVKGTAIAAVGGCRGAMLRRDSAATRHLVWLLAMVAMLVVPVLSAMLPQWRVLPAWAGVSPKPAVVEMGPITIDPPADRAVTLPAILRSRVEIDPPSATAPQPAAELPDSPPAPAINQITPSRRRGVGAGATHCRSCGRLVFAVLILRLMAARWMLWNTERQGTVISSSSRSSRRQLMIPSSTALEAACLQLGIRRPVTLLIHPDKTIPVVWGIFRCRLLLPAAARALERRATAIRSAARARPHQASRHAGSTADADRVCSALVQSAGVVRRLATGRGT